MGLSTNPKENVNIVQSWIYMASTLKAMIEDPSLLAKLTKDAYALPEAEEARANDAREKISTFQGLVEQQKKQKKEIDAALGEISKQQLAIDESQDNLNKRNSDLDKREAALDDVGAKQREEARRLQALSSDLQAKIAKYEHDMSDLDAQRKEIDAYEVSLRAKAAKLKDITKEM